MTKRPVFVPLDDYPFVREIQIEFEWHPGFAKTQAQKSIKSLHDSAARQGIAPILEISSKSPDPLGVALSAFNLKIRPPGEPLMSVECAFQGSKVFKNGGPYTELYNTSSREAKTDDRIRNSGDLVEFRFLGKFFPKEPQTAFYDWLYITALHQNPGLADQLVRFKGFSDIAFNPKKSLNCQARSAALFVALCKIPGEIERIIEDKDYYLRRVRGDKKQSTEKTAEQLTLWDQSPGNE